MIEIMPEMVGSFGISTNPEVSKKFLNALAKFSESDKNSFCHKSICPKNTAFVACHGKISEYDSDYDLNNMAELLLEFFQSKKTALNGIRAIFSHINYSQYSGAIAQKDSLWLFVDEGDLCVLDLRKKLGQILFFPSTEAWGKATKACPDIEKYYDEKDQKSIIFPSSQVWLFQADKPFRKFKVTKNTDLIEINYKQPKFKKRLA